MTVEKARLVIAGSRPRIGPRGRAGEKSSYNLYFLLLTWILGWRFGGYSSAYLQSGE
jgi:hypothetical protein